MLIISWLINNLFDDQYVNNDDHNVSSKILKFSNELFTYIKIATIKFDTTLSLLLLINILILIFINIYVIILKFENIIPKKLNYYFNN